MTLRNVDGLVAGELLHRRRAGYTTRVRVDAWEWRREEGKATEEERGVICCRARNEMGGLELEDRRASRECPSQCS